MYENPECARIYIPDHHPALQKKRKKTHRRLRSKEGMLKSCLVDPEAGRKAMQLDFTNEVLPHEQPASDKAAVNGMNLWKQPTLCRQLSSRAARNITSILR